MSPGKRRRWITALKGTASAVVVVTVFALVLPRVASYDSVWHTVSALPGGRIAVLIAAMLVNMVLYWIQLVAALPGLSLAQAAVANQSSTTVANVVPGGGAVAIGVAAAMLRSWGFAPTQITLLVTTTGVWNSFMKLGLTVVALGLVALTGHPSAILVVPALIGLGILVASVSVFSISLTHPTFARRVGHHLGGASPGPRWGGWRFWPCSPSPGCCRPPRSPRAGSAWWSWPSSPASMPPDTPTPQRG